MNVVKFVILGERTDGLTVELFQWCRDNAEAGVARAWKDAERFGYSFKHIWAEPVTPHYAAQDGEY